jgi:hypothetical protein
MRRTLGIATALAMACTSGLAAQQPGGHPGPGPRHGTDSAGARMHMMMHQHAREMDSLDARLDSLVNRMNRSTGNARMEAMAAVLTELVAQRRAMRTHHREMMDGPGMMHGPGGPPPR